MQNLDHINRHRAHPNRASHGNLRAVDDALPLVELKKVSKEYKSRQRGTVAAVSNLDLTIATGTAVLVTGPSGSGKTTLLSLVGCLTRPSAGRISFKGEELSYLSEDRLALFRRRRFGFVFQNSLLIHGLSALDNVMIPALPRPEVNGDLAAKARFLLESFAVGAQMAERVEFLSGGQQQRVAIARALINDPDLFICDEPTAHLGTRHTDDFLCSLEKLCATGMTVLVASHDLEILHSGLFARRLELSAGCLEWECG